LSIDDDDDDDDDEEETHQYDWLDSMAEEGEQPWGVIPLDRGVVIAGSTVAPQIGGPSPQGSCDDGWRGGAPRLQELAHPKGTEES
jgi:hypothetical protein